MNHVAGRETDIRAQQIRGSSQHQHSSRAAQISDHGEHSIIHANSQDRQLRHQISLRIRQVEQLIHRMFFLQHGDVQRLLPTIAQQVELQNTSTGCRYIEPVNAGSVSIGRSSTASTMSPTLSPAASAGPPGFTSAISTPQLRFSPSPAANVGVIVCAPASISDRCTCPYFRRLSYTKRTILVGIANPMPSLPPLPDRMNVLIPTTLPSMSTNGPPLLPGLMGASVWMYTIGLLGSGWRGTELITPIVIVFCDPADYRLRTRVVPAVHGAKLRAAKPAGPCPPPSAKPDPFPDERRRVWLREYFAPLPPHARLSSRSRSDRR